MTSLIDRYALIAEYDRVHVGEPGGARKLMEEAPEVDAVPVIRCKDCVYNKGTTFCYCLIFNGMYGRTLDNYCSRAERKD